jgi:acyl carrier protein
MSTLETLQDLLMRDYKLSPEQLAADAPLSSMGIDSLGLIELMFQIEDRFGIVLPDDESTNFATLNDVVGFIDKRLTPKPALESAGNADAHALT